MNSRKIAGETISSKKQKKKHRNPPHISRDTSKQPVSTLNETVSKSAPFSPQELREINIQVSASWFRSPEATHLTLMEVNPWRLHAYWNIDAVDMAAARASLPTDAEEPALILRFTDLPTQQGENVGQSFDTEVQGLTNSWYVDLWQEGRCYSAQLGLRTTDGGLVLLATSNEVMLPRAAPSSKLDFKQVEVRVPLPLDLNVQGSVPETIPKTESDNRAHLLKNLFPGRRLLKEGFPEFAPHVSDIIFDEPECPGSMRLAETLADKPVPFKPKRAKYDNAHDSQASAQREHTEFPCVENREIIAYSAQAKKEKARLLAKIEIELPPMAEKAISHTTVDLAPQSLPLFRSEPELSHGEILSKLQPNELVFESSIAADGLDALKVRERGDTVDLFRGGFPEVVLNKDSNTHFIEQAFSAPIAKTGLGQDNFPPVEFQGEMIKAANTPYVNRNITEETAHKHSSVVSRQAPRPIIALEEVLSHSFSSYHSDESAPKVGVELRVHGKHESNSVLSLLGKQVQVDDHGNFSVFLKLDTGSALSALLYAQRKRTEDPH